MYIANASGMLFASRVTRKDITIRVTELNNLAITNKRAGRSCAYFSENVSGKKGKKSRV